MNFAENWTGDEFCQKLDNVEFCSKLDSVKTHSEFAHKMNCCMSNFAANWTMSKLAANSHNNMNCCIAYLCHKSEGESYSK